MTAILAVRTTDSAGSPAVARSLTATSDGQRRLSALVIINTQTRPWCAWMLPAATTSAGRRWRTGRSAYGKGTLTMSHGSKVGIGPPVRLGVPLDEGVERIINRFSDRTRQDDAPLFDAVGNLIPLAQTEGRAHRLWDGSLCLSGEFAC